MVFANTATLNSAEKMIGFRPLSGYGVCKRKEYTAFSKAASLLPSPDGVWCLQTMKK